MPGRTIWPASTWLRQNLLTSETVAPFSFVFDGKPSTALLPGWKKEIEQRKLDEHRTAHRLTWTDAASGLVLRCDAVQYHDFPTVEWTLHWKNTGPKTTAIIENLQAIDVQLARASKGEFVLHHQTGDNFSAHSYEPHEARLDPKGVQRFAPDGGRPTNGAYPYYNVVYDGGGLIVAVGWPGQWAARFERDAGAGLRITAGQQLTHFVLRPGEEVRTPLVVLQFYTGDRLDSQNVWRRWMMAHNLPRSAGRLPEPFTSTCVGVHQSAAGEIGFINAYLKNGIKFDYWWMDAGWYVCRDWPETGTWVPDPKRFPHGIRAVSDYAHSKGIKLILWFEPERVRAGSWLFTKHPQWLLGTGGDRLLDLGNPQAHRWLTEYIDRFLTEQGVDLYRQDFNIDPLGFWRRTTPLTGRASPRSVTSRATCRTGTSCGGGIPACSSIVVPRAGGATTWRRSAGPCRCCAATINSRKSRGPPTSSSATRATPMACRFGSPTPARASITTTCTRSAAI